MVATGDLKSPVFGRTGSSPVSRTILQTSQRAGVIPLEALCRDTHLLWISCTDGRSAIVSGVTDYLL
jgi:hypothetical protein